jgi:hypothetical protein
MPVTHHHPTVDSNRRARNGNPAYTRNLIGGAIMDIDDLRTRSGDAELAEWKAHWGIHFGLLTCRSCHLTQHKDRQHQPFLHSKECPANVRHPQYPWRDLTWITADMQAAIEGKE